ncbi:MAG: sugar ABC transporter substrate-binding protein [Saccharofermentans sp.]|nr:sugar ABC transporter substrate-binding protein [Saccharofermentans sp.]
MKTKKILSLALASLLVASSVAACNKGGNGGKVTEFTMFAAMAGKEKESDNEIMNLIAEKTGVKVKESWLTGQEAGEAIGSIIASGKLPDFIDGGDGSVTLYENHLLVAWDPYLEKYPNLKEMYTDEEWDKFRMDDGKIYWANVFGNHYKQDTTTGQNGEAFWIQARVLEAYGYPTITSLDEYFDLLEKYAKENPTLPNGTPVIPYTCLCEDWKYYCIENAPMFLDGYPNDGCCIVNIDEGKTNPKVVDYNTTPTAEKYFRKLNEEYNKGAIDPDFAIQTYDEYIAKLSTGAVLGLCDQYWDFAYNIMGPFASELDASDGSKFRLDQLGCDYVPLGLTIEAGMEQQWHTYGDELNQSSGVAVTTSCKNPDLAFEFLSRLLDQDIHDLRFWGIEGQDYLVDENGMYYRDETMRENWKSDSYKAKHTCEYSYMPQWSGISKDGKNYMQPGESPSEFLATLSKPLSDCFTAYGCGNYVDMVGSANVYTTDLPWYPLWSWSNNLSTDTEGGVAWKNMGEVKHKWLPAVVMSKDFDTDWKAYMEAYNAVNPQAFLAEAQAEVDARLATAQANGWTE